MAYFDYSTTLTDPYDNITYSGVCFDMIDFSKYESQYKTFMVTPQTMYRPDKISKRIYGTDKFAWVIDEINGKYHPSEYNNADIIYYLPYEMLTNLGVS